MTKIFEDFRSGVLDVALTSSLTTLTSSGLAAVGVVASPSTMAIVLDPLGSAGAPEIVSVTVHTSSASTATVVRGAEGSTARSHSIAVPWVVAATAADMAKPAVVFRAATTTQIIPSGTGGATLIWNESIDTLGGHTPATTGTYYTVPSGQDGIYLILVSIVFAGPVTTPYGIISAGGDNPDMGIGQDSRGKISGFMMADLAAGDGITAGAGHMTGTDQSLNTLGYMLIVKLT